MTRTKNIFQKLVLSTMVLALAQTIPMTGNTAQAADRLFGQVSSAPLMVHVAGTDAFSINTAAGGFSAVERTMIVERNIVNALKSSRDTTPSAVQVVYINNIPVIRLGGFHVVTIDFASARLAGTTMEALANQWATALRQGLQDQTHVTQYLAGLGGDYLPSSENAPYRRARLEASRVNHAASAFRQNVPANLITSDSETVIGLDFLNARNPQAAEKSFLKAISMNAGNSRAHYGLGVSLLRQGLVESSIKSLQMARWIEPDYAQVHMALGQAFETQGETGNAIKQYQEASLLQRDNPEPVLLIADIREGRNDMGKSVLELSDANMRIPSSQYIELERKDQTMWRLHRPY